MSNDIKCYATKSEFTEAQGRRQDAMRWWNKLAFEVKFYKVIECNHLIAGDHTRNPESLSGREIEKIYNYLNK